jgi:hypothetical protein
MFILYITSSIHILIFFLATLANGNISFCHHLVSVVCFLPSFGSFGQAVSEKKFLEIDQSKTRITCGSHVC